MEVITEKPKKNTVPEGYKLTELGIIPEDWETKPLGEITSLMTNGYVGRAKEHYTDSKDGVLYVQGYNVRENAIRYTGIKKVTKEFDRKNSKSSLMEGDLLTVQTGDVGMTAMVPEELEGANCHALIISRFVKEKADPKYVSYYFNSKFGRNRLKELETGTTVKHLNVGDMKYWEIPLPPTLEEQQVIAQTLSDVDALITELDALIEKKQQVKKGAMQQLLTGKKRLPGFDGEWEEKSLGDIANIVMGSSPSSDNYNEDGYGLPLIGGNADIKQRKSIKRVWTTQVPKKCNAGDVIMTVRAPVGTIAVATDESCLGRGVCALQVDSINKSFLYYQMIFNESEWEKLEQGSTFTSANSKQIEEFSISVPENKGEQKAIAGILSDMDEEIQALQAKRDKYEQVKQGMMQELLTGKTRLV